MAFPNAHIYLRINGTFGPNAATNVEKWSSGLRLAVIGADVNYNAAALQTLANAVHATIGSIHSATALLAGATCQFSNVTAARVGTDGLYNPAQQTTVVSVGTAWAGVGTANQPWNTAGVVSLRTDNVRGYASNGRFYYPQLVGGLDVNTGRVASATLDARLALFKTAFDQINTAAAVYAANMRIAVLSKTGNTASLVRTIRADQRLDSIERRENAQPVVWNTKTLV